MPRRRATCNYYRYNYLLLCVCWYVRRVRVTSLARNNIASVAAIFASKCKRLECLLVPNATDQANNTTNLSKNNHLSFSGARGDALLGRDEVTSDILSLLGGWLTTS